MSKWDPLEPDFEMEGETLRYLKTISDQIGYRYTWEIRSAIQEKVRIRMDYIIIEVMRGGENRLKSEFVL